MPIRSRALSRMFEVALVDSGSVIGGTGEALRLGVADGDPGTGEPGTGESGNFGDPISMEISSVLCGKFAVVEDDAADTVPILLGIGSIDLLPFMRDLETLSLMISTTATTRTITPAITPPMITPVASEEPPLDRLAPLMLSSGGVSEGVGGGGLGTAGARATVKAVVVTKTGVFTTCTLAAERKVLAAAGVSSDVASDVWAALAASELLNWMDTSMSTEPARTLTETLSLATWAYAAKVSRMTAFREESKSDIDPAASN